MKETFRFLCLSFKKLKRCIFVTATFGLKKERSHPVWSCPTYVFRFTLKLDNYKAFKNKF